MPNVSSFLIRVLSDRIPSGHDHLPFPMCGSPGGVKRTSTMLWSVGIWHRWDFHSVMLSWWVFDVYILSSHDIVSVLLLKVNSRVVGCVCFYVS